MLIEFEQFSRVDDGTLKAAEEIAALATNPSEAWAMVEHLDKRMQKLIAESGAFLPAREGVDR